MKPLKLQGELASMAGTIMYPNEESAKWDVDGTVLIFLKLLHLEVTTVACNLSLGFQYVILQAGCKKKTSLSAGGCYIDTRPNSPFLFLRKCVVVRWENYWLDLR